MGIIAKQSSSNLIILVLGVFLGALNIVFLYPIVLSKEEFGFSRLFINIAILAAGLGAFGTPSVLIKYLPYYNNTIKQKQKILGFVFKIAIITTLLVALLLFLLESTLISKYNDTPLLVEYYYLLYALVAFIVINSIFTSYFRALYRSVFPTIMNDIYMRLAQTFLLGLFYFGYIDFYYFLVYYVGSYLVLDIVLVVYLLKIKELKWSTGEGEVNLTKQKEMVKYGGGNFLSGIASSITNKIDVLMLGAMVTCLYCIEQDGMAAVALYTWALYISTIVEIPARAVSMIGVALVAKAWKENDIKNLLSIYKSSAKTQLIIGLLIFLLIWMNVDLLFILKPDYSEAKMVILFLGLGKLIDISSGINYHIINTSKYYLFVTFLLVFLVLLTFLTNLFFIPIYGIVGGAIATAISLVFYNILAFLFLFIKYKMQPFGMKTLYVIVIGTSVYYIVSFINIVENPFVNGILKSIILVAVYGTLIITTKISKDINSLFFGILNKVTKKNS